MARSPNVWVVVNSTTGVPVVAFTVKHELCTWLYEEQTPQEISYLRGWKLKDGVWHGVGKPPPDPLPLDLLFLRKLGSDIED